MRSWKSTDGVERFATLLAHITFLFESPRFDLIERGIEPSTSGRHRARRRGARTASRDAALAALLLIEAGPSGRIDHGVLRAPRAREHEDIDNVRRLVVLDPVEDTERG